MARRLNRRDPEPESKVFKKVNSEKEVAFDSDVVHVTGAETISGSKSFVNDLYVGTGGDRIIISDNCIKQMVDGSVKIYNLPSAAGTLALEGVIPEHTHNSLTSGNSTLYLNSNGVTQVRTNTQGTKYYEWSARFRDSSSQFDPPISYDSDSVHGGIFCSIRSYYEPGYDFYANPLPEDAQGEIEIYYYDFPTGSSEYLKRIVAYRQIQFTKSDANVYSAYDMVGMQMSPMTGRAYVFDQGTVPGTYMNWEDTYVCSMMKGNFWNVYTDQGGPIVLNLGPGGTPQTGNGLSEDIIDTGTTSVKTVAFLDDISTVGDQRYAQISHSHSTITSGNTSIAAYNGYGETGGRIIKDGQEIGFYILTYPQDQANSTSVEIRMEIPLKISEFSHDAFRQVQSIKLGITEVWYGGTPPEIVPLQTVQLDHTKFGGPESQYFGIATNGITAYNQEWFSTHTYNWINDIYNAPFAITVTGENVTSFYQAWGPLGTTFEYPVWGSLYGQTYEQIATVGGSDARYALATHNHDDRYASATHCHDSLAKAEETSSGALSSTLSLSGDGTVLVETTETTTTVVFDTTSNGVLDITSEQQAQIDQMQVAQYTGSFITLRRAPTIDPGPNGGAMYGFNFSQDGTSIETGNDMGTCELYPDGTIRLYAGLPDLLSIFNAGSDNPCIVGYAPSSQQTTVDTTTDVLATQSYVDQQIGSIGVVLDAINGEVI